MSLARFTKEDLRYVATGGASLEISATAFSREDLRYVATGLQAGAFLRITNVTKFSREDLRYIATGTCDGATVVFL